MSRVFFHILLIMFLLVSATGFSQSDINMSTHWYNRTHYNPAFITRPDYTYIFSNIRQQWVGVEGAPRTLNVQASQYVHNLQSAFGVSFIGDQIGVSQSVNGLLNYAYRVQFKRYGYMSLGLSGGIYQRSVNGDQFEAGIENDPAVQYDNKSELTPDFNAGIEYHHKSFILGLSSTHLQSIGQETDTYLTANHRYGYIIYRNNNSDEFYYKLGVLVANRQNLTVYEGNAFFRLKHSTGMMDGPQELFDFGISVRSTRQLTLMAAIMLTPSIRIGYSYEQSFMEGYHANGSHEVMLEFRILSKMASTRHRY